VSFNGGSRVNGGGGAGLLGGGAGLTHGTRRIADKASFLLVFLFMFHFAVVQSILSAGILIYVSFCCGTNVLLAYLTHSLCLRSAPSQSHILSTQLCHITITRACQFHTRSLTLH